MPDNAPETETGYPQRLAAMGDTAWERLSTDYASFIRGVLLYSGVPDKDVDDVVQEVLVAVPQKLAASGASVRAFRSWLFVVVRRMAADYHRGQVRVPDAQGGTDALDRVRSVPAPLPQGALHKLGTNPDQMERLLDNVGEWLTEREMKILCVLLDGSTQRDAAVRVNLSEGRVSQLLKNRVLPRVEEEARKLIDDLG